MVLIDLRYRLIILLIGISLEGLVDCLNSCALDLTILLVAVTPVGLLFNVSGAQDGALRMGLAALVAGF